MKIVFLCTFSNNTIRKGLVLRKNRIRNALRRLRGDALIQYSDYAIWVSDFIKEFERYQDIELHVVNAHKGMRKDVQNFDINGTHYHFFKCDGGMLYDHLDHVLRIQENNDYRSNRKRIRRIINEISPDIVILCGAENPFYSLGVLDITDKPVYIILQTLLNSEKRIQMGIGNAYRREKELEIIKKMKYFSMGGKSEAEFVKSHNKGAKCFLTDFPSHHPQIDSSCEKTFDFVYFSRNVTKFKGIEDVIKALAKVKQTHNDVSLNIIGFCDSEYKLYLNDAILSLGIKDNVSFSGYFESIEETYQNVAKARCVVVPGITAWLNSTVRESMLMGLPTICYETEGTKGINDERKCLLTVPLEDTQGLAEQMLFALEKKDELQVIAYNGKQYAEKMFSNASIIDKHINNCRIIIKDFYQVADECAQ